MKVLEIRHIPAQGAGEARVRVGYRAQEGAQVQDAEAPFIFSITNEQQTLLQWYLERYLEFPWGEFRARAERAERLMGELGGQLFEAIFAQRTMWPLYTHVADDLADTRVVVYASQPEGIALPWEMLRDPVRGEFGDIAPRAYSFVRSQPDLSFEPAPARNEPVFRILLVICRPAGDRDVPFQSVARPLLEVLRPHRKRVEVEVLRPPTLERLAQVLGERPGYYHALHFDGHGTFPQASAGSGTPLYMGTDGQGQLLFEGEDGHPRLVTGEQLGHVVAGKGVPLVLLNACQSGMTAPQALYPSVGNQLLRAGVAGVVAMSYSVHVGAAVRFMAQLYQALMQGEELARAVALGREALRAHPQRFSPIGEMPLQDWVVPVVFEAAPTRVMRAVDQGLRLDIGVLQDQQQRAGQEVDCPEPPPLGFVGRDSVLLELERAFQQETIVLLQGMAGVGKTEMAMGFARWRAETGGLDGPIFFTRFEHYVSLAQVCDRVGQVFQRAIKEQLHAEWHLLDADQRRRVAVEVLRKVPCLLIWDNVEPVAGFPAATASEWTAAEQEELRDFLRQLRSGQTKVVLSSRRDEAAWLGQVYRRVEVGGLGGAEAQELAVKVLERAGLTAVQMKALPEYNDLLDYLGGNPLAIQVVLPELRRQTPRKLLATLRTGEAQLGGDNHALGREGSLAASLSYRLDELDPMLRQRLGVLALFQGFVATDVLATMSDRVGAPALISGLTSEAWRGVLDAAAEVGLLRAFGGGYYRVHPVLPWFFHALQEDAFGGERAWLEQAYAAAYGAYGNYLGHLVHRRAEMAISLLSAEEDNLRHALRLARRHEQWDAVAGVVVGLTGLMQTKGRLVELQRLVTELERDVTNSRGEPMAGREDMQEHLLQVSLEIAVVQEDRAVQDDVVQQLREHYERVGDKSELASFLYQEGLVAQERRQWAEAERLHQRSLEIDVERGDQRNQAVSLQELGSVAMQRRRWDEADAYFRRSLHIKKQIGDQRELALTMHHMGILAQERGQMAEAERWHRDSLAIRERLGMRQEQAASLQELGTLASQLNLLDEAEAYYRRSLSIKERLGAEHRQAITLHGLGQVAYNRGQWQEAEGWHRRSLAVRERFGDKHGQGLSLHELGRVAEQRGQLDEAVQRYEAAEALLVGSDDPRNLGIVQNSLRRVRGKG